MGAAGRRIAAGWRARIGLRVVAGLSAAMIGASAPLAVAAPAGATAAGHARSHASASPWVSRATAQASATAAAPAPKRDTSDAAPAFVSPVQVPLDLGFTLGGEIFSASVSGLAQGDFTGSGHTDLAAAFHASAPPGLGNILQVLPGNGDGTFGAPIDLPVPSAVTSDPGAVIGGLVGVNLTGSGPEDLVAGVQVFQDPAHTGLLVFTPTADPTRWNVQTLPLSEGPLQVQAYRLASGDVLFAAVLPNDHVVPILTDGTTDTTRWSVGADLVPVQGFHVSDLAVAPLTPGGLPDIIVTVQDQVDGLEFWPNSGSDTFSGSPTQVNDGTANATGLWVGDFAGSDPSVLVVGTNCTVGPFGNCEVLVHGNGDGTFATPTAADAWTAIPHASRGGTDDSTAPELDGTGHPDGLWISLHQSGGSSIAEASLGDGAGHFTIGEQVDLGEADNFATAVVAAPLTGGADWIVVGGTTDSNGAGGLWLLPPDPSAPGSFVTGTLYPSATPADRASLAVFDPQVAVGNFDAADPSPDLVTVAAIGGKPKPFTIDVLHPSGDGHFGTITDQNVNIGRGPGGTPGGLIAADVNGDGKLDLVWTTNLGMGWALGNGDGTFQDPVNFESGASGGTGGDALQWVKLGPSGPSAIVTTGTGGPNGDVWIEVYTWNSGTGAFNTPVGTDAGQPANTAAGDQVAFGAFTTGGNTDAAVVNRTTVDLLPGNGDGTFGSPVPIATVPAAGGGWGAITAGDVNGDGNDDLVFEDSGFVYVALGNGDGTFAGAVSYEEDFDPANQFSGARQLLLADLSGKGPLDVVSMGGGETSIGMTVLPNNGDGTFGSPQPYALGNDSQEFAGQATAASLAGGPTEDLVVGVESSGGSGSDLITVLLSNGSGLVASGVASPGAAVTPGQSVSTSWTVTNDGVTTVAGPWADSVYLAPKPVFDPSADRLVGSVTHVAAVAPGGSYTGSLTATLPGIPAGTGYLIVVPDSGGRSRVSASGAATSPAFTVNPVPVLAVNGAATTGSISAGQIEYFQVSPQAGIPLSLTWLFQIGNVATVSESLGSFPDPATGQADQSVAPSITLASSLTVSHPDAATYYVMLRGAAGAAAGDAFSLEATQSAFSVTGFGDNQPFGARLGGGWFAFGSVCRAMLDIGLQCGDPPDTLDIFGSGFTASTTFSLVNGSFGGSPIAASSVTVVNPTTAVATFPIPTCLETEFNCSIALGVYNVRAADHGRTATSTQRVVVRPNVFFDCVAGCGNGGYGGSWQPLRVEVSAPNFRPPAPATVTVYWDNTTGWDMPAPLIELVGTNAVLDDPATGLSTGRSDAQLLGVGSGPDAGVLFPGESGSITLSYTQPSVGHSTFDVYTVNPGYSPDWSQLAPDLQPPGVPAAAWTVDWSNFMSTLSATDPVVPGTSPSMAQFQNLLDEGATYLAQIGQQPSGDATQEVQLELQAADGYGAVSGEFTPGAFGLGRDDPTDLALTVDASGNATIHAGRAIESFLLQPGGSYAPAAGGTQRLDKESDGSWQLTLPGGITDRWNAAGQFESSRDAHGNLETPSYDGAGELTGLSSIYGTSSLSYDSSGHVVSETAANGRVTAYTYDASGRMTSITYGPESVSFQYGNGAGSPAADDVTKVTFGAGEAETFTYDSQGRVATAGVGTDVATYHYGPFGQFTITDAKGGARTYWLDASGRVARSSDPLGRTTTYGYGPNGDLASVVTPSGASTAYDFGPDGELHSVTDPMGRTTTFGYGANLYLTSVTQPSGDTTTYGRDVFGDLTSITLPDGTRSTAAYNAQGLPITETSANGISATISYSAPGQVSRVAYGDGTTVNYGYDAAGDLTSASDPSGTVTYGYDAIGELTSLSEGGHTLNLTYDADGRVVKRSDDSGFKLTAAYDADGQLASITDGSGTVLARWAYDALGRVSGVTKSNGTTTAYAYDAAGELTGVANTAPGGATDSSSTVAYGADGLPTSVTGAAGTSSYAYDAAGELTSASEPGPHHQSYSYDLDGNRTATTVDGATTTYTVNSRDEYTAVGGQSLTYDAAGDLTGISGPGGAATFTYNDQGHLVSAATPGGSATYAYDAGGNLASSTSGGSTVSYLPDPLSVAGNFTTYDNSGAVASHAVQDSSALLGSESAAGATTFFDTDANQNVVDTTGSTGAVASSATFDPFGNVLSGAAAGTVGFSGAIGDRTQPTGLIYAKARFYDPGLGRFVSPDSAGIPGANPYTYALDSPMGLVDPNGHDPETVPSGAVQYFNNLTGQDPTTPLGGYSAQQAVATTDDATSATSPLSYVPVALQGGVQAYAIATGDAVIAGGTYQMVAGTPSANLVSGAGKLSTGLSILGVGVNLYKAANDNNGLDQLEDVGNAVVSGTTAVMPPPLSALVSATAWAAAVDGKLLGQAFSQPDDPQWGSAVKKHFPNGFVPSGATSSTNLFDSDPNDLFGPSGFGTGKWVLDSGTLPYQVTFENEKTATAPVQVATITATLPAGEDASSFRFGSVGFGSITAAPPAGSDDWSITVPDTKTMSVRVQGSLDAATGAVSWTFTAVDPATGEKVSDPAAGFLPPDVNPPQGDAFVNYTVSPKAGLAAGTALSARASIVFDTNAPIATPVWTNKVDTAVPAAKVAALPSHTTAGALTVRWSGSDKGGPGVAAYDVFVSVDHKAFSLLLRATKKTSTLYRTAAGHSYGFVAVATDDLGLRQPLPKAAQATTVAVPPQGYYLAGRNGTVLGVGAVPALAGFATAASDPLVGIAVTPDGKGWFAVTAQGRVHSAGDAVNRGGLLQRPAAPVVSIVVTTDGRGYWLLGADGQVYPFGDASFHGDLLHLPGGKQVHVSNIVGMVAAATGSGYLLIGADGGVFALGAVHFYGSLPSVGVHVDDIRGILPAPGETGYVLVGADGGAFVFGHGAPFKGSLPGEHVKVSDIVGLCLSPSGEGYWMAGANGVVYPFGDAVRFGAPAGLAKALPLAAIGGT